MTDRFRYLPCEWHEALYAFHLSEPAVQRAHAVGFKPRADGWRFAFRVLDLAHPAGWDHAVRAVAALVQVKVDESESVNFWLFSSQPKAVWAVAADGLPHHFMAESGEGRTFTPDLPALQCDRDPYDGHHVTCGCRTTPEIRREALCRCVCAALNLNPEEVFPDV